jgi:hypothetical protein
LSANPSPDVIQPPVRLVKKAEKESVGAAQACDIIPPELAEAIRQFMRREWQRLRRDELFHLRVGMKSELAEIERELSDPLHHRSD